MRVGMGDLADFSSRCTGLPSPIAWSKVRWSASNHVVAVALKPQPKRHHYLPESYLRRFTREGEAGSLFWVYDIEKREIRPQTPHNTGCQRHYYCVTMPDGSRNADLETAFSRNETSVTSLMPKVERSELLSDAARSELAYFLALLKVRVPQFETECNQTHEFLTRRLIETMMGEESRIQDLMTRYEQDSWADESSPKPRASSARLIPSSSPASKPWPFGRLNRSDPITRSSRTRSGSPNVSLS